LGLEQHKNTVLMKNNMLPVKAIRRRDVDILLLEEFNCSNDFCKWFVKKSKSIKIKNKQKKTPFASSTKA